MRKKIITKKSTINKYRQKHFAEYFVKVTEVNLIVKTIP